MKKYINGKLYDTDTAQLVGDWNNGCYADDFYYCYEALYRRKSNTYFLHCEGGALSKYSKTLDNGQSCCGNEFIKPVSYDEAMKWAEEKLDAEIFEKHFADSLPAKDDVKVRLHVVVSPQAKAKLERASAKSGKPASQIIDDLIMRMDV